MELGLLAGAFGSQMKIPIDRIRQAESAGFTSVWTAEAYGSDAVTPAAWILAQTEKIKVGTAIMQMPARSPAMTAMTAMTLNQLSGGRFLLGLGPSGPQVIEGWHGVAYGRPLTRTKEYIDILRQIFAREGPATYDGYHYQLPYRGEDGTGLGKPLRSILAADTSIPIYTASISPKGVECSAEVADGVFPVWMNPDVSTCSRTRSIAALPRPATARASMTSRSCPSSPSSWATTWSSAGHRSRGTWPSTSAAWARATRTSTTTTPSASATQTKRR